MTRLSRRSLPRRSISTTTSTYIKALNELLGQTGPTKAALEDVIRQSAGAGPDAAKLFNNAAQAWNHAFFWESMAPKPSKPCGNLDAAIRSSFDGLPHLREAFVKEGAAHFGSGWVWLVAARGKLAVKSTHDAHDLVTDDASVPLLVCDLWEHAYYLDCVFHAVVGSDFRASWAVISREGGQ